MPAGTSATHVSPMNEHTALSRVPTWQFGDIITLWKHSVRVQGTHERMRQQTHGSA
jgi:hypothetical protein